MTSPVDRQQVPTSWFAAILVAVLVVPFPLVLGVNLAMDPFQLVRRDPPGEVAFLGTGGKSRYQHAGIIRHYQPRSIVVGHSLAANFRATSVERILGWQDTYNLALNGAPIYEHARVVRHAMRHNDIEQVLWLFSPMNLRLGATVTNLTVDFPEYLYDDSSLNDLGFFTTLPQSLLPYREQKQALRRRLADLRAAGEPADPRDYSNTWYFVEENRFNVPGVAQAAIIGKGRAARKAYQKAIKGAPAPFTGKEIARLEIPADDDFFANFHQNLYSVIAENPGTRFNVVIVPPLPRLYWQHLRATDTEFYRRILAYVREAVTRLSELENVTVYAFGREPFTADLRLYKDHVHYHIDVNDYILESIAAGREPLTPENVVRYLAGFDRDVRAYRLPGAWPNALPDGEKLTRGELAIGQARKIMDSWGPRDGSPQGAQSRPNILLILADDLGNNDIGWYGDGVAQTPNIDALARGGVRFRRHYANATCRPSRMALLSGVPSSRIGVPPHVRGITPERVTLPEALGQAGYQTVHIGKWHLGHWVRSAYPDRQGFDDWYGFLSSLQTKYGGNGMTGASYIDPWLQGKDRAPARQQGHMTDLLTDAAIGEIRRRVRSGRPWFINLWYFAPHQPIQPAPRFAKRFSDTPEGRYLALVAQLDHNVGRLLAALDETGQRGDTLVVFLSDNGGTNRSRNSNKPYFGKKNSFREGGQRTPFILSQPGSIAPADIVEPVLISDVMPTLLAYARVPKPGGVSGRNVLPLLAGEEVAHDDRYFWEFGVPGYTKFGLLDFARGLFVYNDTQQDWDEGSGQFSRPGPAGEQVLAEADSAYRHWARETRRVELQVEREEDGRALLGGDSYRRTPGFGGWTLQLPVDLSPGQEVGVAQPGRFSIEVDGTDIHVAIPGHGFSAPAGEGGCQLLSLATYYTWSERAPETSGGVTSLYSGEQLLYRAEFTVGEELLTDRYDPIEVSAGQPLPLISNDYLAAGLVQHYEALAGGIACD